MLFQNIVHALDFCVSESESINSYVRGSLFLFFFDNFY